MRRIRDGDIDVFSEIGACLDHAPSSKQFRNKRGLLTSSKPMTRQFSPINKEAKRKIHGRPDNLVHGDDDLSEFQLRAKHVGGKQPGFDSISPKVRINKGDDFAKLCEANFIIVDPSNKVKFFCQCCASRITNKMESVRDYVGVDGKGKPKYKRGKALGERHRVRKQGYVRRKVCKDGIYESLRQAKARNPDARIGTGDGLLESVQLRRASVVLECLKHGVALHKFDDESWRALFETDGTKLCGADGMSQYIPLVHDMLRQRNASALLNGLWYHMTYDGQCRQGELLCVVLRIISVDFRVKKILLRLLCTVTSMTGEQLAQKVLEALTTYVRTLGDQGSSSRIVTVLSMEKMVGITNDGCSVNGVCNVALVPFLPNVNSHLCVSHFGNNTGGTFVTPQRALFMLHWAAIFVASPMARDLWNARLGYYTSTTYSVTRWHDGFKIETTAFHHYADLKPFLEDDLGAKDGNSVICPEHRRQLLAQQYHQESNEHLQVELAAVQDKATSLVNTTYRNEGEYEDEIFRVYDRLMTAKQSLESEVWPNTRAVVKNICTDQGTKPIDEDKRDRLMQYARDCTQPAADYFQAHLVSNEFAENIALYKAFRLFNPAIDHAATNIDGLLPLKNLRYIENHPDVYDELVEQLPAYLAVCATVTDLEKGVRVWWQDQYRDTAGDEGRPSEYPQWIEIARLIAVQVPSSAIVERVFSLVKALFSHTQVNIYGDAIETAVMANMSEDKWQQGENL